MATLAKAINKNFLDSILPVYGNPRENVPTWDNSQKMFICNEHESTNGNRYYCGIRFCERIVIVEKVGLYHNWTYIDGIELYAFNGKRLEIIQKRDYDKVFRKEDFIRNESQKMVYDYLKGVCKSQKQFFPDSEIDKHAKSLIEGCYKSFLDRDYNTRLTQILPVIGQN